MKDLFRAKEDSVQNIYDQFYTLLDVPIKIFCWSCSFYHEKQLKNHVIWAFDCQDQLRLKHRIEESKILLESLLLSADLYSKGVT